jgi:predicted DNA-binding transcriptional regulator AlpA
MQTLSKQDAQNVSYEPDSLITLPKLMNQRTLANYIGKSVAWCENARWQGKGPKFLKLGRNVRYRATDVEDWLRANERQCSGGH